MKKVLIFTALFLALVFVVQAQAIDKQPGHPWEDFVKDVVGVLSSDDTPDQKADRIKEVLSPLNPREAETILRLVLKSQLDHCLKAPDENCVQCLYICNGIYGNCLADCDFFDKPCQVICGNEFLKCIIRCDCDWGRARIN